MRIFTFILWVLTSGLSFASDQAAIDAFDKAWDKSVQEAVTLYPEAADDNSALSKAVAKELDEILANPNHPLRSEPTIPMLLVPKHAARLGITPTTSRVNAGSVEQGKPIIPERKHAVHEADWNNRVQLLVQQGIAPARAEYMLAERGFYIDPNLTAQYSEQLRQQALANQQQSEIQPQRSPRNSYERMLRHPSSSSFKGAGGGDAVDTTSIQLEEIRQNQQRLEQQIRRERIQRDTEAGERELKRVQDENRRATREFYNRYSYP